MILDFNVCAYKAQSLSSDCTMPAHVSQLPEACCLLTRHHATHSITHAESSQEGDEERRRDVRTPQMPTHPRLAVPVSVPSSPHLRRG